MQRHLVRGQMSGWFYFGRVVGPLAMLGGAVTAVFEPGVGAFIFGVGLLLTLILETSAFVVRRGRCWLEVQDTGFTVIDRRGQRQYRDDEVHAIAYSTQANYSNGEENGFTRRATLWLAREPQPLRMQNLYKKNQVDPLAPLLGRLIDLLRDGFDAALQAGHAIEGDGWRLTQTELFFRRASQDDSLRLAEVAAIENRDGKMGVWRKGMDEPYVQFSNDGRNVWLLRMLVSSRMVEDAQPAEQDPAALGRILFQRKAGKGVLVLLAVVAAIAVPIGLGMAVFATELPLRLIGVAIALGSPLLVFAAYAYSKSNFRCHERGVYKAGFLGEKKLMYSEVGSFTYSATRHYHNGAYVGTHLSLKFDPLPGSKSPAIHYSAQVTNADNDLDELRDFVAGVVASRMGRELAEGHAVPWTKNMIFRPEGIEYTPSGFFGRKATSLLSYENYGGWNMDQGVFHLFERGNTKAVMNEQSSEANFYPGFFLLLQMFHQEQSVGAQ